MENQNNFMGNEKLEYGQIILGHIKEILKISRYGLFEPEICVRYQTAILVLADALYNYYDDEMRESEQEFDRCKKLPKYENSFGHYREFFRALMGLLQRNNYLKSVVYGEDRDELAQEEGEND